ncbi:DUF4957 domain-containing protein [Lewinella sp. IMCC34183]|uniref:DUF4957 domain-containing protein n=1 Tax=Lewinella sp. IMCC34183 TaxID=2248762 RepID=UPI001E5C153B|nr:DUF4957 domain-containing protein [Lewinella sp. IMCC34183]
MSTLPKVLFLLLGGALVFLAGCEKEEIYEETRLFRPVLNEPLEAELNTIIVNMGNIRRANSYTIEVSRDSFASVLYTFESDTNYFIINEETLNGESLLYATLYQVRATAHADEEVFDSRPSELGDVRTERFPSPLLPPSEGDLLDGRVRVRWQVVGAPVTYIRVFAGTDERLTTPLDEFEVDEMAQDSGVFVVNRLSPLTSYQIAIYSGPNGETLRGWEYYTTTEAAIDLTDPNVIDLSNSNDPDTLTAVVNAATDGQVIVLQKGVQYNFPADDLDKSITFRSSSGFGEQKPVLYTTGNWNIVPGSTIDHVRFIDVELRGEDYGGDYVFNPNVSDRTVLGELSFENCIISNFRGIIRIRTQMFLGDYIINNSIVHTIGGYGAITADTDGVGNAAFDNIRFTNSTFAKMEAFITTRQNAQSVVIDNCTMNEFVNPDGLVFRWRGEDGILSNVINGITITNSIWGPAWDLGETGEYAVRGIYDGLENTTFTITNTYATENFAFVEGKEIPGFPNQRYNGTAEELWVAPYDLNFNFEDTGFAGINDAGDPRWRPF